MNRWKTKVVEVLYGRMWFLAGMVVLMFCLSLFCSDARALYDIHNSGSDHVSGLYGINARWATGPDFGTVSAEATYNDAYGLFNDSGDVEIVGDFGPVGVISATSGDEDAYGLYSTAKPAAISEPGRLMGQLKPQAGGIGPLGCSPRMARYTPKISAGRLP